MIAGQNILPKKNQQSHFASAQNRTHCLIILSSDGKVEVYGPKSLQPRILNQPEVNSVADEIRREQLIEDALPGPFRDVFWPGMLRSSGWWRQLTPRRIAELLTEIDGFAAVDEVAGKPAPSELDRLRRVMAG